MVITVGQALADFAEKSRLIHRGEGFFPGQEKLLMGENNGLVKKAAKNDGAESSVTREKSFFPAFGGRQGQIPATGHQRPDVEAFGGEREPLSQDKDKEKDRENDGAATIRDLPSDHGGCQRRAGFVSSCPGRRIVQ